MLTVERGKNPAIYICGPKKREDKFYDAAELLRVRGYRVINPVALADTSKRAEYATTASMQLISYADAVLRLPGWENDPSSTFETGLAYYLDIPVYDYFKDILREVPRWI